MVVAGDFKNGVTFEMDGNVMQVIEFQHVKPGKGAAFVRTKIRNVITGGVVEKSFSPTDKFENAYMRSDIGKAFNDIRLQLSRARRKPSAVRIHASGEIETTQELREWLTTAIMTPGIPFYIYTKAYEVLDGVLSSMDTRLIPKNFFINVSIWHEDGIAIYNKWKHLDCIRAFVYDDGYDYSRLLKIDCYCPAYDKNGKLSHDLTCDKCKICFQKKAKVCGCYSH